MRRTPAPPMNGSAESPIGQRGSSRIVWLNGRRLLQPQHPDGDSSCRVESAGQAGTAARGCAVSGDAMATRLMLTVVLMAMAAPTFAQTENPLTGGARQHYGIIKGYVRRAADKMPESDYAFRPKPEVRSFAQLVGHLADANYR